MFSNEHSFQEKKKQVLKMKTKQEQKLSFLGDVQSTYSVHLAELITKQLN